MSTEHNYTFGSEQYLWLEQDLQSVNRTLTPWVVFGGHRPMYINSDYGGSPNSDIVVSDLMIANLEPLLWKYRVNFAFYGHNHAVQRQSAVLNKTVIQAAVPVVQPSGETIYVHDNPQATVHLVIGTGGAQFTINAVTPPPAWNELVFYKYGYSKLTAVNASCLDWVWIESSTGLVQDHMVLYQTDPDAPWVLPAAADTTSSDNDKKLSSTTVALIVVFSVLFFVSLVAIGYYAWLSYAKKSDTATTENLLRVNDRKTSESQGLRNAV
jgi:hypothetical protein